jgi:hypothetical protein
MVHGAIYDAVNAIAGKPYQPYLGAPAANGTESMDAAVATAAYQVLVSLFPSQQARLQTQYDQFLAAIPDGPSKQGGISVGAQTAAAMIAARQNDGAFGPQTWVVGTQPGQWRPTPPTFASAGAWTGHVKPFLIPSASMFRTSGPPALTSKAYAKDYNEVKKIGAVNSTTRTADQTDSAKWWHDRRLTEWEIKRQVATSQGLNTVQAARMFAMVDMTETDAVIACYNEKEAWNFWRPVTAIQLGDTDGNSATTRRPDLDAAARARHRSRTTPRPHLLHLGVDDDAGVLLQEGQHLVQRVQPGVQLDPALHQLLAGARRGGRGPHLGRHSLPHRRQPGREDRTVGLHLHGGALLQAVEVGRPLIRPGPREAGTGPFGMRRSRQCSDLGCAAIDVRVSIRG